jgi:hypothetical protein
MSISPELGQLGPKVQLHCQSDSGFWNLQGWPRSANASRHMLKVEHDETVSVGVVADNSHTSTAFSAGYVRVVDADVDLVITSHANKAAGLCSIVVDISNIAVGGIALGIKPHLAEKVAGLIVVLDDIVSSASQGRPGP